jgi:penicillin-binding protein 1A
VRQAVFAQYGDETYVRGLNVYTTLDSKQQQAAYQSLRRGVLDFERRQYYRGPEVFLNLPNDPKALNAAIDDALADHPDNGELLSAVVLEATPRKVVVSRDGDDRIEITGDGLKPVQSGLSDKAPPHLKLRRGAVVRIVQGGKDTWFITQMPEVESAFVAMDPRNGAIHALVGGFDFQRNKFNHVTQAWRQPGSSFKPFIYSAALEKGLTPATVVNDSPLFYSAAVTGGKPWEPKNYDGKFEGPMSVRGALAKSKNMVSIRVLEMVGTQSAQEWVTRFGFEAERHPPYLTMALGAGSVTPMQMATGYAVFANGGYRVAPYLITRITDDKGKALLEVPPSAPDEANRAIEPRNAFIMSQLLQEITRSGTAARAQGTLKRPDLYGKTGTTNDAVDAWFVGFQPTLVAATWVGYDNPRNLGSRETGGGLALPIWISFMGDALKGVPVEPIGAPAGVIQAGGEWYYEEFGPGHGVASLGLNDPTPENGEHGNGAPVIAPQDRRSILDLFRN